MKFTIKRWENDGKKTNRKMEIRKNERKKSFKGLNTEFMEWMESENEPIRFLVP